MSQDNILSNRIMLATNVKKLRSKSKIRREELSLALGFDNSYISKLEKGKINITIDKLSVIADYFNVDLVDLFIKS
ncbi:helix-turn-helix transcriptional regulator [bacterium]|nr:helix-turn-helix transcriptional regulator [bacterium]